ncbi:hypothetical protein [Hymenobacter psychrotolerans]|uniref:Uncharacterized protein n=1 Tax=Hymenobacter psychrotolerans DSM 18569 TaxID=1121959 RepID=A0A1M7E624_9BACT|nr:hypothetical protein [Hymenobacter psychrotolerans]SHL87120.1 hypothetical protein SAMN02746009_03526 [Hymenobacter psychrotolerans DSM 18569]
MNLRSLNLPPAAEAARLRQLRLDQRSISRELDELQQSLPPLTPHPERQRLLLREHQLSEQLRNVCGSLHQLRRAQQPPFALAG